jgi:hypothetical protein
MLAPRLPEFFASVARQAAAEGPETWAARQTLTTGRGYKARIGRSLSRFGRHGRRNSEMADDCDARFYCRHIDIRCRIPDALAHLGHRTLQREEGAGFLPARPVWNLTYLHTVGLLRRCCGGLCLPAAGGGSRKSPRLPTRAGERGVEHRN